MTTVPNNHDDQDRKLAVEPDSVDRLLNELAVTNTKPLWVQMTKLNPPQPVPKTIPFIWRFDDIRPYFDPRRRAGCGETGRAQSAYTC
jgi:gentisate 1,2-dioxygenase